MDNLDFACCDVDRSVFFKISDRSVFFKISLGYKLTIILVYVDDCTIVATSIKLVDWVKSGINSHTYYTTLDDRVLSC